MPNKYTLEAVHDHYEVYNGEKTIRFIWPDKNESGQSFKARAAKYFNRYWKNKKVKQKT